MFFAIGVCMLIAASFIYYYSRIKYNTIISATCDDLQLSDGEKKKETQYVLQAIAAISVLHIGIVLCASQFVKHTYLWEKLSVDLPVLQIISMFIIAFGLTISLLTSISGIFIISNRKKYEAIYEKAESIILAVLLSGIFTTIAGFILSLVAQFI